MSDFMPDDFTPTPAQVATVRQIFTRDWALEKMLAENRAALNGTAAKDEFERNAAWLIFIGWPEMTQEAPK